MDAMHLENPEKSEKPEKPEYPENPENPDESNNENKTNEGQKVTDEANVATEGEKRPEGANLDGDLKAEGDHSDVEQDGTEGVEPKVTSDEVDEEKITSAEDKDGENLATEEQTGEGREGEKVAEELEGEQLEGEQQEGEQQEGEQQEEEQLEGEQLEGEQQEGEQLEGEQQDEEQQEGEEKEKKQEEQQPIEEPMVEEEEKYVEEPPPDPAAPYDFSDSKEALRPAFELRPDQVAEVEQLWEAYQNYTPVYSDLDGYITETELVYMLKSLLIMTYTPEQLQELIAFCVRPPHPKGHISYEQFLRMVTLRQRDFPVEEELRSALQAMDPEKTGLIDREFLRDVLAKQGHKIPQRQVDNLIKEVDLSNDGTVGIEDIIGTMCIDLNREDIILLRRAIFPDENPPESEDSLEF